MNHLNEVLKRMGWLDGFQIPVANEENKTLEEEIVRLCNRKAQANIKLKKEASKFDALQKHLKHVCKENEEIQKLLTMNTQYLSTEENKYQCLKMEKEITEQNVRKMSKQIKETINRQESRKADIEKGVTKIEKFKAEISWDSEALKAWESSIKKRDEDNELLIKFAKEDDSKFKELEAKRAILQKEVLEKRKLVGDVVADMTNYECVIERTGRNFKQQIAERDALVKQWQEAVRNLKQRDTDINRVNLDIISLHELKAQKLEILEDQKRFLENQKDANKEIEEEIAELRQTLVRSRREFEALVQFIAKLQNESVTIKQTLASTNHQLEKHRAHGQNLTKEIAHAEARLSVNIKQVGELEEKLNGIMTSSATAGERVRELELMLEPLTKAEQDVNSELERIQATLYRAQQCLQQQKEITVTWKLEIHRVEGANRLLRKEENSTFEDVQRQLEVLYIMEYRLTNLERKLTKLEHQGQDLDLDELGAKLDKLEKSFAEQTEINKVLNSQVQKLQEEMRRITTSMSLDEHKVLDLKDKLQDQVLLFDGSKKQMEAARIQTQQRQVEYNLLNLRINYLEKAMKKEEKHIYNSQKLSLELNAAMQERHVEITASKEVLHAKKRNLDEEKGRLKLDINGRKTKIDQLQKKYHIAVMSLGKDEEGQPMTITYFKIKNAQEKYMLQREGDELDTKIHKTEKEIIAMENTLRVVNSTNDIFKKSLTAVEEDGPETRELKDIDKEYEDTLQNFRQLKKEIERKYDEIDELYRTLDDLRGRKEQMTEEMKVQIREHSIITRGYLEKKEKIEKMNARLKQLDRKLVRCEEHKDGYNTDVTIRLLEDTNRYTLQKLTEIAIRYQEVEPLINRYMSEHDLNLTSSKTALSKPRASLESLASPSSGFSIESTVSCTRVTLQFDETCRESTK